MLVAPVLGVPGGGVAPACGGLVMMRSTPAGNACVNKVGVMVLASIDRRVSHSKVASGGEEDRVPGV